MSTADFLSPVSGNDVTRTTTTSGERGNTRQQLATLAAEFESMLLTSMLRDMRTSGRWESSPTGDTLGADVFDQTFDVELSRYLSNAGGFGLSQRLLEAFEAVARAADVASAGTTATAVAAGNVPARSLGITDGGAAATPGETGAVRRGWNNMRMDAPPYGGSGAQWAGFNNDRAMSGGDDQSIKDAFFRWTYGLSFNPAGHSKEEIESFLRNNLESAREYGLNILDVDGEKILIEGAEGGGAGWTDVVENAGSPTASDVRWQWLCESDSGIPSVSSRTPSFSTTPNTSSTPGPARFTITQPAPPATVEELRTPDAAVTSAFGWRLDPFTAAARFHTGVDLRAAAGDPVATTGAGRVVFSGSSSGYGTNVVVEHSNGLSTRYAHLQSALVGLGDTVDEGTVIGLAGQSGRATAPHLHYEVLADGRPVDPLR